MKFEVMAAVSLVFASCMAPASAGFSTDAVATPVENPLDAAYLIETEAVTLVNGRAERAAAPGSASRVRTQVVGTPAYGDIDGDGDDDAVLLLVRDSGGSGIFHYVAAARKVDGGYIGSSAVLIGDRISPFRLEVVQGVVVLDYLERAPGEPMAAEPTVARTACLAFETDTLTLAGSLDSGERNAGGRVTIRREERSSEPCDYSEALWLSGESHALWLGRRVLAVAAAIRNPDAPDAMDAVIELGQDSRYYVMVRGWLVTQLSADKSIVQAGKGDVSPQIAARIAFLEKAIRAIDLE